MPAKFWDEILNQCGKKSLGAAIQLLIEDVHHREADLLDDVRRAKTSQDHTLSDTMKAIEIQRKIHDPTIWVRFMVLGASQTLIDKLRKMFPAEWIPGHETISKTKVFN